MATTKAQLSNGRTITVDNTQIDIKFTRSSQQFLESRVDARLDSLSRAQISLGLYYDGQRRLVDVLGRRVEGLSLSQIRLGMWGDDTGKARAVSGGFAEGLTRIQLGQYADEKCLSETKKIDPTFTNEEGRDLTLISVRTNGEGTLDVRSRFCNAVWCKYYDR